MPSSLPAMAKARRCPSWVRSVWRLMGHLVGPCGAVLLLLEVRLASRAVMSVCGCGAIGQGGVLHEYHIRARFALGAYVGALRVFVVGVFVAGVFFVAAFFVALRATRFAASSSALRL